ncbi:glycosyl transferase family 11 [Tupanvirus soda lake]|uniref:Glycosyl transferase family 11 n=2 Tax=Tupanvirus TaxID=2094720 RepID=A0A6N1NNQ0_9VIRU|nr:glycosyl transferase family 11 [Tupanvirus soda lake]QKU35895.1 glycosyl transferase family 11 [Tupanvirus soda lake]
MTSTTLTSYSIYITSCNGFGNKVFDLISAVYLQNKYKTNVYFITDKSINDKPGNPFFGNVFYKSSSKVKYITMDEYYGLKETIQINEDWIDDLSKLPTEITTNIHFGGLYRFAYIMYSSLSTNDKKLFEINPNLLNNELCDKYINKMSGNYACVHIRYGDKLCYGLKEFKHSKYTPYALPVYTPQFYIDQINELLKQDLTEILVITDSIDIVKKYITNKFYGNPKIVIMDSCHIDSFYLLTKAKYIVLSHSTFSFSSAYFNPSAICFLLKKYMINVERDYVYIDDAISPNWIVIDNQEYLLNFNQKLLKELVVEYAKCNEFTKIQTAGKQPYRHDTNDFVPDDNKFFNVSAKKIKNQRLDEFVTNGPITIDRTKIGSKLIIYGTLYFNDLDIGGVSKVHGTVYGRKGVFNKLNIYGPLNIQNSIIYNLSAYGSVYAYDIDINKATIFGPVFVRNTDINKIKLLSDLAKFDTTYINTLVIDNTEQKPKKITVSGSIINNIIVIGKSLTIRVSKDTNIINTKNATIVIDKDL